MVALAAYSMVYGDLGTTLRFLFGLDLSGFSARAALEALGLGFFSIGVGFGVMITYAAYAEKAIDLRQAALASAVSMLELAVALITRRFRWSRLKASLGVSAACFIGGLPTVFSFNLWAHWKPTAFAALDDLTSNVSRRSPRNSGSGRTARRCCTPCCAG